MSLTLSIQLLSVQLLSVTCYKPNSISMTQDFQLRQTSNEAKFPNLSTRQVQMHMQLSLTTDFSW